MHADGAADGAAATNGGDGDGDGNKVVAATAASVYTATVPVAAVCSPRLAGDVEDDDDVKGDEKDNADGVHVEAAPPHSCRPYSGRTTHSGKLDRRAMLAALSRLCGSTACPPAADGGTAVAPVGQGADDRGDKCDAESAICNPALPAAAPMPVLPAAALRAKKSACFLC